MEGARLWDRRRVEGGGIAMAVRRDLQRLPTYNDVEVEDASPTIDPTQNPLQEEYHSVEDVEAMAAHLKRSLEGVVIDIFSRAREADLRHHSQQPFDERAKEQPLRMRWVPAYFPFTSPSWELEVQWENTWLELLGCGIVKQPLLNASDVPDKLGWAFGVGLERIAMLLFSIPDIRLFWSTDERFLNQFAGIEEGETERDIGKIKRFVEFSKYPPCWKDVAFWLPATSASSASSSNATIRPVNTATNTNGIAGDTTTTANINSNNSTISTTDTSSNPSSPSTIAQTNQNPTQTEASPQAHQSPIKREIHENDIMALIRDAGSSENIEDVTLVDEFIHSKSGRISRCYRIMYRRLDRTLTNSEVNTLHDAVRSRLADELGVELR